MRGSSSPVMKCEVDAARRETIGTPRRHRSRIGVDAGTPPTPVPMALPLPPAEPSTPANEGVACTPHRPPGEPTSANRPPPPHARPQRHSSRTAAATAEATARASRICVGLMRIIQQGTELQRWVDSAEGVQCPLDQLERIVSALQLAEDALSRLRACIEGASQRENVCAALLRQADKTNALNEAYELGSRRTPALTMLLHNLLTSISATACACVKQLRPAPSPACLVQLDDGTEEALRQAELELSRACGTDGCLPEPAEGAAPSDGPLRPWSAASSAADASVDASAASSSGSSSSTAASASVTWQSTSRSSKWQTTTIETLEWEACVASCTPQQQCDSPVPRSPRPPSSSAYRARAEAAALAARVPLRRVMHQQHRDSPPPYGLGAENHEPASASGSAPNSASAGRPFSSPLPLVDLGARLGAGVLERLAAVAPPPPPPPTDALGASQPPQGDTSTARPPSSCSRRCASYAPQPPPAEADPLVAARHGTPRTRPETPAGDGWRVPVRPETPAGDGWRVPVRPETPAGDGWRVPVRPETPAAGATCAAPLAVPRPIAAIAGPDGIRPASAYERRPSFGNLEPLRDPPACPPLELCFASLADRPDLEEDSLSDRSFEAAFGDKGGGLGGGLGGGPGSFGRPRRLEFLSRPGSAASLRGAPPPLLSPSSASSAASSSPTSLTPSTSLTPLSNTYSPSPLAASIDAAMRAANSARSSAVSDASRPSSESPVALPHRPHSPPPLSRWPTSLAAAEGDS
jgi:hypothetical protein